MSSLELKYVSMNNLPEMIHEFINDLHYSSLSGESLREIEHYFIESLAVADSESIIEMLDIVDKNYFLEFPVWARLLSYRLVCLLRPEDAKIKLRAIYGISAFGPDWDDEVERLESELKEMTGKKPPHK